MNIQFTTKPFLPALVVSVVLFITVFLPWFSFDAGLVGFPNVTVNGTHDWGVLTLIMSIVGAGLSFVATQRTRALGLIIASLLALIGAVIYWANNGSVGFGLIIALIASIAMLYIGYMDYRKSSEPSKPAPPPSAPPAPPPPQQ